MFKERNQRGGNRHNLTRRYVHQGDVFRRLNGEFVHMTDGHQIVHQLTAFDLGARLGDDVVSLFNGRQEDDLVGHFGVFDTAVRAFQEAVLVGTRVGRQGVDQTNVRTFRGLNRTYATVVGRVYVTDFEAGTLTGQTARAKSRHTALVGDLGQRVVLVHELGQLAGTEEFLDRGSHRLGVDQILRHQAFAFGHGQTLFDRALDAHQTDTELVLGHLANGADTTVTQVVDIVNHALAVTDVDQGLEYFDDVFLAQHAGAFDLFATDATVELHAANGGQVVTLTAEEQVGEQRFGGVLGRRLARAHHAIDFYQRFELSGGVVDAQGIGHERTAVDLVGVQRFQTRDLRLGQLSDQISGDFGVAVNQDLTGSRVHDRLGDGTANQVVERHFQAVDAGLLELIDVARSNTTAFLDNNLALGILDIKGSDLATQTLGHQLEHQAFALHFEHVGVVEHIENFFGLVTEGAQQHTGWQLAATVDTHEDTVFGVKLEVQPGAAVRNHASGVQQLAGAVRLATVVVKEHTRAAVQLGHDDALGTVDDEGTVLGHQGDFPHIDFLLLDVLDRLV